MPASRHNSLIIYLACAAALGWSFALMIGGIPRFENGTYTINEEPSKEFIMPLRTNTGDGADIRVQVTLHRNAGSPGFFRVIPDDCLHELSINGQPVTTANLPYCDFTEGRVLDLSPYLTTGENTIEALVHNNGGEAQFSMRPVWSDSTVPVASIVVCLSLLIAILLYLYQRKTAGWKIGVFILFFLAGVLRVYYVSATPYWIRGHDTDGHIEYIEHLMNEGTLPSPDQGWESWQPPLYYAVSAVWGGMFEGMGFGREDVLFSLQILSLLLSLWTLWIVWKIGRELFVTEREASVAVPILSALIVFIPSLVFLSARINNDVLLVPLAFLSLLYLQRWWNGDRMRDWILCLTLIGLCMLSKSNGILLLPIAFGALAVKRRKAIRKGLRDGLIGLIIVSVIAGWFSVWRMTHNTSQDLIVGNTSTLNSGLAVYNGPSAYLTFNPIEMVRIPYNNPWSDDARRQYFWEYLYRSAFFGEFNFGADRQLLASWLIAWSLPVFLLAITGFILCLLQWKRWTPMLLTAAVLPLGHAVFRWEYPYGSSQDFRYIIPVLVALAAFAALSVLRLRIPVFRSAAMVSINVFAALCAMFLLHS